MDIHRNVTASPEEAAEGHLRDLKAQRKYGVRVLRYWFNQNAGTVFCLVEAPSPEAAMAVHREAHGLAADDIMDAVVVVDVVKASGTPGEVRLYDKVELVTRPPILALSPHEPGLREAILNAEFHGATPRFLKLVGVVPEGVGHGPGLSAPVRDALPAVVERVREELAAMGFCPRPRAVPLTPDVWWERKVQP